MMKLRRLTALALCLAMIFCGCALAREYRTLEAGMAGDDVYALKMRLHELGYIKQVKGLNKNYSQGTANFIRQLQANNGLPETGIATPELQELIYSDRCVTAQGKTAPAAPAATAAPAAKEEKSAPAPRPMTGAPQLPETDEEGFMLPGAEPYVYASRETGHWYYITQNLRIEIHKYSNPSIPLEWFESYVSCRGDEKLQTYVGGSGKAESHFKVPKDLAKEAGFVFATSDDFYGFRVLNNYRVGSVMRNGEVLHNQQAPYSSERFPVLDVMAIFPGGEMKTYYSDETTAEALKAQGAEQVFCFGPVLIRDGVMDERVQNPRNYADLEPRHAIGMLSPNHYVLVSVLGRRSTSEGVKLKWVADKMMELGCREAFNLDGGNTLTLVFMGDVINRAPTNTNNRTLTSLIGFGNTAQ